MRSSWLVSSSVYSGWIESPTIWNGVITCNLHVSWLRTHCEYLMLIDNSQDQQVNNKLQISSLIPKMVVKSPSCQYLLVDYAYPLVNLHIYPWKSPCFTGKSTLTGQYSEFSHYKWWFSIINGDIPSINGDFPIINGAFPIINGDFPYLS